MSSPLSMPVTAPAPTASARSCADEKQAAGTFATVMQGTLDALTKVAPMVGADGEVPVPTTGAPSMDAAATVHGTESEEGDPRVDEFADAGVFTPRVVTPGATAAPLPTRNPVPINEAKIDRVTVPHGDAAGQVPAPLGNELFGPGAPTIDRDLVSTVAPPSTPLGSPVSPVNPGSPVSEEAAPVGTDTSTLAAAAAAPALAATANSAPPTPISTPRMSRTAPPVTPVTPVTELTGGTARTAAPAVPAQAPASDLVNARPTTAPHAVSVSIVQTGVALVKSEPTKSTPAEPKPVASPLAASGLSAPITAPASAAPAAPVAAAAPAVPVPFTTQIARPIFTLAGANPGEHVLTIHVTPDNLGPVTVRAHMTVDSIRVELFAPTDMGRDALRAILPDLRRDLAGSGMNANLDLSSQNQTADPGTPRHGRAQPDPRSVPGRQAGEPTPEPAPRAPLYGTSSTIDVMA